MKDIFSYILIPFFVKEKLLTFHKDSYRIVYFHYVGYDLPNYYKYNSYLLTPNDFRQLIKFYKNHFEIISLNEAIYRANNLENLKNCLSLSTDDGYKINYTTIAPICYEEKVPITFFISTDSINNRDLLWNNQLIYLHNSVPYSKLKEYMIKLSIMFNLDKPKRNEDLISWSMRTWDMKIKKQLSNILWKKSSLQSVGDFLSIKEPYLTSLEIKELASCDLFTIGSHSKSHPIFDKLSYKEIEEEILGSFNYLEEIVGKNVDLFAYPYGIRPDKKIENKFIIENKSKVKTLLGIKNSLKNFNNPYKWERDRQEFSYNHSITRFVLLPIIRNLLK